MRRKTDKVIVLDIDETLVYTFTENNRKYDYILNLDDETEVYRGVFRDHLQEFIDFCFLYFKYVIVWSAGTRDYVHNMVDIIFTKQRPYLILTYDDIVIEDHNYYKPLRKIFNTEIRKDNTYFIDDREENFREDKINGIVAPQFTGQHDDYLLKLENWFLQSFVVSSGTEVDKDILKDYPRRDIMLNSRANHLVG